MALLKSVGVLQTPSFKVNSCGILVGKIESSLRDGAYVIGRNMKLVNSKGVCHTVPNLDCVKEIVAISQTVDGFLKPGRIVSLHPH